MRIRDLMINIRADLKPCQLKNCTVVIDGQNYLYNMYENSGFPFQFGCESNKYAQYLRDQLSIFKKANVKCYFIFKGGNSDDQRNAVNVKKSSVVVPVFMKEIYKEVLGEMDFNHVVCEFESKKQCIALARQLDCPLISYDSEFIFSGVNYIPSPHKTSDNLSLRYDERTRSIHCSVFSYTDFVRKHKLDNGKLAIFVVLTDETILNDFKNICQKFYDYVKLPRETYVFRNKELLNWLSRNSDKTITKILQECLQPQEFDCFTNEMNRAKEVICREETPEIPCKYLMQKNHLDFSDKDPMWFQKGVAYGFIPLQYVNIYHWNIVLGSWCIEDNEAEDGMFLSLDIIKYAYSLLTNFEKKELLFKNKKGEVVTINLVDETAVPKPIYTAAQTPFENGWANIRSLRLFEHFLKNSMPSYDFSRFNELSEEVLLLMISLVYFSQKKFTNTAVEVCSVLLSYVMLGVVADKCGENHFGDTELVPKPILDPITDKELVTGADSATAEVALEEYFIVPQSAEEVEAVLDRQLLHPLVEFQHCLQQLNLLNKLCGSPFESTRYARTFNGTFVYQVTQTIRTKYSGNVEAFVEDLLSPAPTVLAFFNGLKRAYEEVTRR